MGESWSKDTNIETVQDMDMSSRRTYMRHADASGKWRASLCGPGEHPVFRDGTFHCRKDPSTMSKKKARTSKG